MLEINYYKKSCVLTDSEVDRITEFLKNLHGNIEHIVDIHLYIDEQSNRRLDITGFDKPVSKQIGSCIKHDRGY